MNILSRILLAACLCALSCYTNSNEEPIEQLPSQPSSIQPTQTLLADTVRIELYYPKPFQSLASGEINFLYKTFDYRSEIYIFTKEPDLYALQNSDFSGCAAGISELAGHPWNANTARLGASPAVSQFYACAASGSDILSSTEKATSGDVLNPGTYYWFIVGYDDDYYITHSSEVRIFMIL